MKNKVIKVILWRVISIIMTFFIVLIITGNSLEATSLTLVIHSITLIVHFIFELWWEAIELWLKQK